MIQQQIIVKKENVGDFYNIKGRIGEGAFATIFKCERKSDKKLFALKKMKVNDKDAKNILYECSLGKLVNSQNVVKCDDVFEY